MFLQLSLLSFLLVHTKLLSVKLLPWLLHDVYLCLWALGYLSILALPVNANAQVGMGIGKSPTAWAGEGGIMDPVVRYMTGSSWDDDGILQMGDGGPTHDEHTTLLGEDARQGQPQNVQGAAAMKLG